MKFHTMFRNYVNTDGLKVQLPEEIFERIKKAIIKFYPSECGGVFVGKIAENKTAIIEDMEMPKRFQSNRIFFRRSVDYINQWLFKIFQKSKGDVIYLGDWHSHPDMLPVPSTTDYNSIRRIANHKNTRIETPVLLIVGYNKEIFDEKFYVFFNEKLISYEFENG